MVGVFVSVFGIKFNFFHFNFLAINRNKPWFRKKENLKQTLEKMNKILSSPFISPLLLETIDFNHIPLYLYPLTYDSFLDDSIEMAKRWKKGLNMKTLKKDYDY